MRRRDFVLGAGTLALIPVSGCRQAASGIARVRAQFGWIFDAHHTGFIVAASRGLYKAAGLDVQLIPGGSETNPVRMVVSGAAEFGQAGGIEQLVTAIEQGLPARPFAAIQRKSPHALISTTKSPIRQPKDIRGKTIAVAFGDTAEILLRALLKRNGISISDVKLVPFRFDLTPLLDGSVDAVTGFRTDQPATILAKGQTPITLAYDEFGVSSYGYTLFSTDLFFEKHRNQVVSFIQASRLGWEEAFSNPAAAIADLRQRVGGSIDQEVETHKLQLIRDIMLDPNGKLPAWNIDPTKVLQIISYLKESGQVKAPDPTILARRVASGSK